jgi:hypothetical protein
VWACTNNGKVKREEDAPQLEASKQDREPLVKDEDVVAQRVDTTFQLVPSPTNQARDPASSTEDDTAAMIALIEEKMEQIKQDRLTKRQNPADYSPIPKPSGDLAAPNLQIGCTGNRLPAQDISVAMGTLCQNNVVAQPFQNLYCYNTEDQNTATTYALFCNVSTTYSSRLQRSHVDLPANSFPF